MLATSQQPPSLPRSPTTSPAGPLPVQAAAKPQAERKNPWASLPPELVFQIAAHCDQRILSRLARCCVALRALLERDLYRCPTLPYLHSASDPHGRRFRRTLVASGDRTFRLVAGLTVRVAPTSLAAFDVSRDWMLWLGGHGPRFTGLRRLAFLDDTMPWAAVKLWELLRSAAALPLLEELVVSKVDPRRVPAEPSPALGRLRALTIHHALHMRTAATATFSRLLAVCPHLHALRIAQMDHVLSAADVRVLSRFPDLEELELDASVAGPEALRALGALPDRVGLSLRFWAIVCDQFGEAVLPAVRALWIDTPQPEVYVGFIRALRAGLYPRLRSVVLANEDCWENCVDVDGEPLALDLYAHLEAARRAAGFRLASGEAWQRELRWARSAGGGGGL